MTMKQQGGEITITSLYTVEEGRVSVPNNTTMTRQRRRNPVVDTGNSTEQETTTSKKQQQQHQDEVQESRQQRNEQPQHRQHRRRRQHHELFVPFILVTIVVVLSIGYLKFGFLSKLTYLRLLTTAGPIVLSGYAAVRQTSSSSRMIIPVLHILAVLGQTVPVWIGAAAAILSICIFSIATLPTEKSVVVVSSSSTKRIDSDQSSSTLYKPNYKTTFACVILMVAVLLIENFMVWVVSATFLPGQSLQSEPKPLQDNGQLLLQNYILYGIPKQTVVHELRRSWNALYVFVSTFCGAMVVAELSSSSRRSLFGVATRSVCTIALARTIRTISFIVTVVPSQVRDCYRQRFPFPVPPTWSYEWFVVGALPRNYGGCNDLIVSGHAVILSTLCCLSTSLAEDRYVSVALWSVLVFDFAIEIYEGFHYSVDMWLGVVLATLLWQLMKWTEGNTTHDTANDDATKQTGTSFQLPNTKVLVLLSIPAIVAYIQIAVLPTTTTVPVILGFVLTVIVLFVYMTMQSSSRSRTYYVHYIQHVLLCLLILALGVFL